MNRKYSVNPEKVRSLIGKRNVREVSDEILISQGFRISGPAIARIASGETKDPQVSTVRCLAKLAGTSMDEFMVDS